MLGCNILVLDRPNDYNISRQHSQMLHEKFDYFQMQPSMLQHVATLWPHARNKARKTQYTTINNFI